MKQRRLAAIRALVERDAIRSQEQLRQRLATRGFAVTQATLSRDIKALGLVKRAADGAYQTGGPENAPPSTALVTLGRALAEYLASAEAVQQLVVLRTGPGQAPSCAKRPSAVRFLGAISGLNGSISTTQPKVFGACRKSSLPSAEVPVTEASQRLKR